jgi:VWFA-related protein
MSTAAQSPAAAPPTPAASPQAADKPAQEISTHDETTTFRVKVNLVLVRVVVRDAQGNAIGNLQKEDFQLFDNGKPQTIRQFTVEQAVKPTPEPAKPAAPAAPAENAGELPPPVAPNHYVAYVFDDVHLDFADLARVREGAARHMATLGPADRAAIFTTSGVNNLDFTDDRTRLQDALNHITIRPLTSGMSTDCPDLSYYQADLIQYKNDPIALSVAEQEVQSCSPGNGNANSNASSGPAGGATSSSSSDAERQVRSAVLEVLSLNEHESRVALSVLSNAVRRLALMPGQRTLLLLSPGFIGSQMELEYGELVEQALRAQVTISALNARGLYVLESTTAASNAPVMTGAVFQEKMALAQASALAEDTFLADIAYDTGGSHFHDSNDFDEGFRRIATPPEYAYMLSFSPPNLKLDGQFHNLKVTIKDKSKLNIQARKGYYAPKHLADPAEEAKEDIEDALFSQEEMHGLPVQLSTKFFKSSDDKAQLSVLAHVDVKRLRFRRTAGRNANSLTVVSGVFDRNGVFISGLQKVVDMNLKDDTLNNKLGNGVVVKSSFEVAPGSYLVRLVVRDADGELSAANGSIEIP